jgi:ribosomal subunit interface protein
MQSVKIVIRNMPNSPALEEHIRKKAEKITQHYQKINSCQIAVEIPQKHKRNGKLFKVRIDLTVPGKEIVVNRKLDEDVYVAIRDAFDALIRQLDNYACKRRGDVKVHESANYGYVSKLFPEDNYGFIQGIDGNEFYFSTTNVSYPSFEQLAVGDIVQFLGIPSDEGLQAHRVTKEKKNNLELEVSH